MDEKSCQISMETSAYSKINYLLTRLEEIKNFHLNSFDNNSIIDQNRIKQIKEIEEINKKNIELPIIRLQKNIQGEVYKEHFLNRVNKSFIGNHKENLRENSRMNSPSTLQKNIQTNIIKSHEPLKKEILLDRKSYLESNLKKNLSVAEKIIRKSPKESKTKFENWRLMPPQHNKKNKVRDGENANMYSKIILLDEDYDDYVDHGDSRYLKGKSLLHSPKEMSRSKSMVDMNQSLAKKNLIEAQLYLLENKFIYKENKRIFYHQFYIKDYKPHKNKLNRRQENIYK